MVSITVNLAADLRKYGDSREGISIVKLEDGSKISDVLKKLGIPEKRVKMMMINGRGISKDTPLKQGDRLALFPPELAFNVYVSLYFGKGALKR